MYGGGKDGRKEGRKDTGLVEVLDGVEFLGRRREEKKEGRKEGRDIAGRTEGRKNA